jgi:hypothetical protein
MWRGLLRLLVALAPGILGMGCATITSGKDQALSFESEPVGAECILTQGGLDIAKFKTPNMTMVRRAATPLVIACTKPGYHQTRAMIASTTSTGAWGNLVVGGIIGIMVDQSTGAAFRYYDPPKFALLAASEPPPESSYSLATGVTFLPPTTGPAPASPAGPANGPLQNTTPAASGTEAPAAAPLQTAPEPVSGQSRSRL